MIQTIVLKQLFDHRSSTYSYLLVDTRSKEAVLIDSVFEQHARDLSLINELELKLTACLDTHCHADHVTGAWLMRHELSSQILASANSGIESLDRALQEGDRVPFGDHYLLVRETPGHTGGCISLILDDESMVFTGDSLLIRGCGRTDFQQGSARKLFSSIKRKLFTLPDECIVYPAHDYNGRMSSSIGEEKGLNPRIGGKANEEDFVGYLDNMQLPHPKQLDVALPANIKSGQPGENKAPVPADWAPVVNTYSQVLQIAPRWVAANRNKIHILDVRTLRELEEECSLIEGAQNIPLSELRDRIDEVPDEKPIMTMCRSGRRSVLAFSILREAGRQKVANIDGGMLRWQEEGLPVK